MWNPVRAWFKPMWNRTFKRSTRKRNKLGRGLQLETLDARCLPSGTATVLNIREATGADATAIQATVDQFRSDLGDPVNGGTPGSQGAGRRQIDWDAVPDGDSAPGRFPGDFFNSVSPRGAIFTGDARTSFQVSADSDNPAAAPVKFGNINPTYTTAFGTFSAERLFTPLGTNVMDIEFVIPGSDTPAAVSGFGAVFTDVDNTGISKIEYFDCDGVLVHTQNVLATAGDGSLSFAGVTFTQPSIGSVRLTMGEAPLGNDDVTQGGTADIVALDDFIYGEPQPVAVIREATGADATAIQATVDQFRADLGEPVNDATPGSQPEGRRQINWDGVPDGDSAPGRFPGDFFNAISPRGVIFDDGGLAAFQVSADSDNPAAAPVNFGNINPTYSTAFSTFSAERLFTPLNTNVMEIDFVVPGTTDPAVVTGFGAVFTDVDTAGSSRVEFFDDAGNLILSRDALATPGDGSLSFVGASFPAPVIAKVRLTVGQAALGNDDITQGGSADIVVLDDFIYGEPQPVGVSPPPPPPPTAGAEVIAVGGSNGTIRVFDADTGNLLVSSFSPFAIGQAFYTGLMQVAVADFNGDGNDDIWVAPGNPAGEAGLADAFAGKVFVYDGADLGNGNISTTPIHTFTPFANTDGPFGTSGPYTNGLNIAVGDVNGNGTIDLIAGTRGGSVTAGTAEFGRFVVVEPGTDADGTDDTILGDIIKPFGNGYQKGVFVAAGDLDAETGDEVGVTRGAPVAASNPNKTLKVKAYQLNGGTFSELNLTGQTDTNGNPVPLAPFANITGPSGEVLERDARLAFVDQDGDGKAALVISILDPLSTPGDVQVRIGTYMIDTGTGLATLISTGNGTEPTTFVLGNQIVDHAIAAMDRDTNDNQELGVVVEAPSSGLFTINPITGATLADPLSFNVLTGGVSLGASN